LQFAGLRKKLNFGCAFNVSKHNTKLRSAIKITLLKAVSEALAFKV
jgi:hypothetical protein